MKLKEKNAVITGGNRGIGRAISLALANKGVNIVITYYSHRQEAHKVLRIIKQKDVQALPVQVDVSDFERVEEMVNTVKKEMSSIDILVNNAGITGKHSSLSDVDIQEWQRVIDVNLTGVFNCCKIMEKELRKNNGKIVNISSISGRTGGIATGVHYDASKAGIIGLTFSLARELAPEVTVNAIAPGPVDTDIITPEAKDKLARATPLKRIAQPEEIAHTVIFLLENDYVSGEVVDINAARYMA